MLNRRREHPRCIFLLANISLKSNSLHATPSSHYYTSTLLYPKGTTGCSYFTVLGNIFIYDFLFFANYIYL
jgi:hypothetical protein